MAKILTKEKTIKYSKILVKGLTKNKTKLTREERKEIKAYSIKKALKIKRYVRN